jgi:hypothetical protein
VTPTLYLADLVRRAGALRADAIANPDGSYRITYWFRGGKTREETTAVCRLVLHDEKVS